MAIPCVSLASARLEIGLRFHSHIQSDLVHLFLLLHAATSDGTQTHTYTWEMSHSLYESHCLILNACGYAFSYCTRQIDWFVYMLCEKKKLLKKPLLQLNISVKDQFLAAAGYIWLVRSWKRNRVSAITTVRRAAVVRKYAVGPGEALQPFVRPNSPSPTSKLLTYYTRHMSLWRPRSC